MAERVFHAGPLCVAPLLYRGQLRGVGPGARAEADALKATCYGDSVGACLVVGVRGCSRGISHASVAPVYDVGAGSRYCYVQVCLDDSPRGDKRRHGRYHELVYVHVASRGRGLGKEPYAGSGIRDVKRDGFVMPLVRVCAVVPGVRGNVSPRGAVSRILDVQAVRAGDGAVYEPHEADLKRAGRVKPRIQRHDAFRVAVVCVCHRIHTRI